MDNLAEENKDRSNDGLERKNELCDETLNETSKTENELGEKESLDDNTFDHGMKDYVDQWKDLFENHESCKEFLKQLRLRALKESLQSCFFRSVCWEVFLGHLSEDVTKWKEELNGSRNEYNSIKEKHVFHPHDKSQQEDVQLENPLSQSDDSCWSQFFKSSELKDTIEKDVRRTNPEMSFFHSDDIKTMMTHILFCYAQEHQPLSYRQGMHELLAPIIYVRHFDLQIASQAKDRGTVPDIIHTVLKEEYMEHDSYAIFCHLMNTTSIWYSVSEQRKEEDKLDEDEEVPVNASNTPLAITNKLNAIHNKLLANNDVELFQHLNRLVIIPQVYGLRWVRLLFGREFKLMDLLVLWDALFADSRTLDLVDYIFVAMMFNIRQQLLASSYCECMNLLMKYPQIEDVRAIVHLALYYKNPKNNERPGLLIQRTTSAHKSTLFSNSQIIVKKDILPSFNLFSNISESFRKSFSSSSAKSLTESGASQSNNASTQQVTPKTNVHSESSFLSRFERLRSKSDLDHKKAKEKEMCWREVKDLKRQIIDLQEKCRFCCARVDASINLLLPYAERTPLLQEEMTSLEDKDDESSAKTEEIPAAIHHLKQVRDVLGGSLNVAAAKAQDAATN